MEQVFDAWCEESGFSPAQRAMFSDLAAMCSAFNTEVAVAGELGDAMVAVDRARATFEGHVSVLMGDFDRSGDWAHDGLKSPTAWMLSHTGSAAGRVHRELAQARVLRECPHASAAYAAGRLSSDKVRFLLEVRKPEVLDAFVEDEERLCTEIEPMRAAAARRHLWAWYWEALERLGVNEPDRFDPPSPRSTVRLAETIEGRNHLDGDMTAEHSAVLDKAFDDLIARWRQNGELTPEDDRSWDELRADALIELVSRGAGDASPRSASVIALIDADTLTRRAPDAASMPFTAELAGQGPIDPEAIRRLACEAAIHPVFHRGGHEILDVGRAQRLATPAIRKAVYARSGGLCEVCHNARLTWCQIHHIDWWENGGVTSVDNSVLVCTHCHHLLHEGHHTLRRTLYGFQLVRPDGTLPRTPFAWRHTPAPPPDRPPRPEP